MRWLPLALIAACGYGDPDFGDTLFKCDLQNPCPTGFFCNGERAGVCVEVAETGCAGQPLSHYWGIDSLPELDAGPWAAFENRNENDIGTDGEIVAFDFAFEPTQFFVGTGSMRVHLAGTDAKNANRGTIYPPVSPRDDSMDEEKFKGGLGDLSGKIFSARVMTLGQGDPASSVTVKVAIEQYEKQPGAFGPPIELSPLGDWKCVSVNISEPPPQSTSPNYDPHHVSRIGLQIVGPLGVTIYVDDVGY